MTEQISPPAGGGLDIEIRKKKRWPWILGAVVVVAAIVFGIVYSQVSNRDKAFGTTLDVATWSTDIAAENLLQYIATDIAPDHGITINPVQIDNLIEINRAVDAGNVAGNFFEHQPFLNDAVAANGFELTLAAPTFTWDQRPTPTATAAGTSCPAARRSRCATIPPDRPSHCSTSPRPARSP